MGCCSSDQVIIVENDVNKKKGGVHNNNNKIIETNDEIENKNNNNDEQINSLESFYKKIENELNRIADLFEKYDKGNKDCIITAKNYRFYLNLKFTYGKIKQIIDDYNKKVPINENNKIDYTNVTSIDLNEGKNMLIQLKLCETQQDKKILEEIGNSLELRLLKRN
jgi:hypothetical protein